MDMQQTSRTRGREYTVDNDGEDSGALGATFAPP